MSFNMYVGQPLNNNTDLILQQWGVKTAPKAGFSNSALSNAIDKDTLQIKTADGLNDGKISFKEKIKNFGKGIVAPFKAMVSSPKNIAITVASAAAVAGVIALTGGAAAPVFVAAGLIGGGVQIGKGIYKQSTAKTDAQAASAWQDMGSGAVTLGLSAAGAKSSLKMAGVENAKNMSVLKASTKCITSAPKQIGISWRNATGKISGALPLSAKGKAQAAPDAPEATAPKTETPPKAEATVTDTPETKAPKAETTAPDTPETKAQTKADTPESVVINSDFDSTFAQLQKEFDTFQNTQFTSKKQMKSAYHSLMKRCHVDTKQNYTLEQQKMFEGLSAQLSTKYKEMLVALKEKPTGLATVEKQTKTIAKQPQKTESIVPKAKDTTVAKTPKTEQKASTPKTPETSIPEVEPKASAPKTPETSIPEVEPKASTPKTPEISTPEAKPKASTPKIGFFTKAKEIWRNLTRPIFGWDK